MRNPNLKVISLAFTLSVAACVSSCYVWDSFDPINRLDSIKPGVTTKEEIIKKFGKPDWQNSAGNSIKYTGIDRSHSFELCGGGGCSDLWKGVNEWQVYIHFDKNNVVTNVLPYPGYLTYHHSFLSELFWQPNFVGIQKQAGIYCPNADLGHADAQLHIGDFFYYGAYEKLADPIRAWVWYSLAAKNGDSQAKERLAQVSSELTPEQLEEAKRQLAAWKPGQCIQDLTPGPNDESEVQ